MSQRVRQRFNPRRASSSWQDTFVHDIEQTKDKWPTKAHEESALHDLVVEHKYDFSLGVEANKKLFQSRITHPMGCQVMESGTFTDMKWWFESGKPDAFSTAMYDSMNDFELWLADQVKQAVQKKFKEEDSDKHERMCRIILKLLRAAPAGDISVDKILDPHRSSSSS